SRGSYRADASCSKKSPTEAHIEERRQVTPDGCARFPRGVRRTSSRRAASGRSQQPPELAQPEKLDAVRPRLPRHHETYAISSALLVRDHERERARVEPPIEI